METYFLNTKLFLLNWTIIALTFISCSDDILSIDEYNTSIVVDGFIYQNAPARVNLTYSIPYFTELDSTDLQNYVITSAKVTVSDGEAEEVLTLYKDADVFPPYYYKGNKLKGEINKEYTITVSYHGQTLTASTTIPEPVSIDSIWFKSEANNDSLGALIIQFNDDNDETNYYRITSKILTKDTRFVSTRIPNLDDELFNGQTVNYPVYRGSSSYSNLSEDLYYQLGDTLTLRFETMDKASFEFWKSFQNEVSNSANPIASTNASVKSNITNGLGVWCGYGRTTCDFIIKK